MYARSIFHDVLIHLFIEKINVTFERHDKGQWCAAGSFDFVGEVDYRLALAFLHGKFATAAQLTALAHDLAIVRHLDSIEDQLVLTTTQVLNLYPLVRLDFLAIEVEYGWRGLILQLDVQHQLLPLDCDRVLQLLVEAIGVCNLHRSTLLCDCHYHESETSRINRR